MRRFSRYVIVDPSSSSVGTTMHQASATGGGTDTERAVKIVLDCACE